LTEPGTAVVVELCGDAGTVVFVAAVLVVVVAEPFFAGAVVTGMVVAAGPLVVATACVVVVVAAGDVTEGVELTPAVVVLVVAAQFAALTVSESSVTAPLRASTRPLIVAPLVTVMLARAMTVPTKLDPVPRVAELVTCQ
jgi:hypothetical protein